MKDRAAENGVPFFGTFGGHGKGHHGKGPGIGHQGGGLMGEVTKVEGQTITVKTPDGAEKTAVLTDTTEVRKGRDQADASAITVGAKVAVRGEANDQGVVTAAAVHVHDGKEPVGRPGGPKAGPKGRGHRGGAGAPVAPTSTGL